VIIHQADQDAVSGPCQVLSGDEPIDLADGVVAVPVPGHTAGSTVLVVKNHYLFSGDHLWWNAQMRRLGASQSACWFSWSQQQRSMSRLLNHRFSWVLPGHGDRIELPEEAMRRELLDLVGRMAETAGISAE
jgi:glyoxylase-like metal-dependent hydrolase (beta-lactamase superfamily II)